MANDIVPFNEKSGHSTLLLFAVGGLSFVLGSLITGFGALTLYVFFHHASPPMNASYSRQAPIPPIGMNYSPPQQNYPMQRMSPLRSQRMQQREAPRHTGPISSTGDIPQMAAPIPQDDVMLKPTQSRQHRYSHKEYEASPDENAKASTPYEQPYTVPPGVSLLNKGQ